MSNKLFAAFLERIVRLRLAEASEYLWITY
jgi:hypothetical protein